MIVIFEKLTLDPILPDSPRTQAAIVQSSV